MNEEDKTILHELNSKVLRNVEIELIIEALKAYYYDKKSQEFDEEHYEDEEIRDEDVYYLARILDLFGKPIE